MTNQLKAAVDAAIAPLKNEIQTLKAQVAELAPLLEMVQAMHPPPCVVMAQVIFKGIPQDIIKALNVTAVQFDASKVWFRIVRKDGTTISVKKQQNDLRIRYRDQAGRLLKEINPSFNGLNAALASLT